MKAQSKFDFWGALEAKAMRGSGCDLVLNFPS